MYEGLKPCPHRRVDETGHILCGWIKGGDNQVSVNLCRACPVPQINCEHLRAALQKTTPTPITVRYATGRVEVWNDEAPTIAFNQAACAVKTMPIHSPRDCAGCPLRVPHVIPQTAIQIARQNRPAEGIGAAPLPVPTAIPSAAGLTSAAPATAQRAAEPVRGEVKQPPVAGASTRQAAAELAESDAAQALVRRARDMAARKQEERRAAPPRSMERAADAAPGRSETKSKIILLQQWLAEQMGKKARPQPPAPPPDEDGVSDIVYAPIAPTYQEEPGLERCVGWTD